MTWRDAWSWAVTSDNEFVFKIKALHCTPLEFRIGFLVGGFNLKVPTVPSLPLQQQGDTTKQLQRPRRHYHLPDLSSCPVAHLNVSEWSDGLTAVISCFLVLKLPGCVSHKSECHRHLHLFHAGAGTFTPCFKIAGEAEISVLSKAVNRRTKTDPQFAGLCLKPRTEPPKGWANWRLSKNG